MKRKLLSLIVMMLVISIPFTLVASAGSEEDPEVVDEEDTDVFNYLDIVSAWFYEKAEEPDYLYTAIKLKEINPFHPKQHLVVNWEHNGIDCASCMVIGYGDPWFIFNAGYGHGWWFEEHYVETDGEYDLETGIIIHKIPKEIINNPQKGDVLTKTRAAAFERFGFIGRMGFSRSFLRTILITFTGKDVVDNAPELVSYGRDYIIQY